MEEIKIAHRKQVAELLAKSAGGMFGDRVRKRRKQIEQQSSVQAQATIRRQCLNLDDLHAGRLEFLGRLVVPCVTKKSDLVTFRQPAKQIPSANALAAVERK